MKIMIIDDQKLVSDGIFEILNGTGLFYVLPTWQVESISEAMSILRNIIDKCWNDKSEQESLTLNERISKALPDLIILEIMLENENGLDFFSMLGKYSRSWYIEMPPVLVCSGTADDYKIRQAINMGACGFVSKTDDKDVLLEAIEKILVFGERYVKEELVTQINAKLELHRKFSKKEWEVLNLVKQNKTNQEIAEILRIKLRTVENYISKINKKSGLYNREEIKRI